MRFMEQESLIEVKSSNKVFKIEPSFISFEEIDTDEKDWQLQDAIYDTDYFSMNI